MRVAAFCLALFTLLPTAPGFALYLDPDGVSMEGRIVEVSDPLYLTPFNLQDPVVVNLMLNRQGEFVDLGSSPSQSHYMAPGFLQVGIGDGFNVTLAGYHLYLGGCSTSGSNSGFCDNDFTRFGAGGIVPDSEWPVAPTGEDLTYYVGVEVFEDTTLDPAQPLYPGGTTDYDNLDLGYVFYGHPMVRSRHGYVAAANSNSELVYAARFILTEPYEPAFSSAQSVPAAPTLLLLLGGLFALGHTRRKKWPSSDA